MKKLMSAFIRGEEGQDLIEYALLAGLIALAAVVGITLVGTNLLNKFNAVATSVAS